MSVVLVSRAAREGERTAARLAEHGHRGLVAPVLQIVATGPALPAGPFDGVVATSSHGLDIFADEIASLQSLPLHRIGTMDDAGFASGERGEDARSLATTLLRTLPRGARLLYLAGRERKPDLELALTAGGLHLEVAVVYEARALEMLPEAAADALRAGALDAALHYSRRSAAICADLVTEAGLTPQFARLRHICISHDCALGLGDIAGDVIVADAPSEAAMIARLG